MYRVSTQRTYSTGSTRLLTPAMGAEGNVRAPTQSPNTWRSQSEKAAEPRGPRLAGNVSLDAPALPNEVGPWSTIFAPGPFDACSPSTTITTSTGLCNPCSAPGGQ